MDVKSGNVCRTLHRFGLSIKHGFRWIQSKTAMKCPLYAHSEKSPINKNIFKGIFGFRKYQNYFMIIIRFQRSKIILNRWKQTVCNDLREANHHQKLLLKTFPL